MDRNNDGVIARAEWRGNQQAFENQDWNNDGVLSGEEIEAAGGSQAANRPARRVERFEALDVNNSGRIEPREWTGTVAAFNRLDANNDNVLSRAEMVGNAADEEAGVAVDGQARDVRFESLDANNNGRIEPREWNGTVAAFNRLDVNNDNVVTRAEMMGNAATDQSAVGTSGQLREVRVESRVRWTDTGIDVRAGQTVGFDARGTVRLGPTENEVAGVDGTLSRRRDNGAPMANQAEGALIARIGNSPVFFVGDLNSVRAPATGRLYLGVNDGDLGNNSGDFQVVVSVQP
jgi:Ca2+-binding EF-hand superfamily protein